MADWTSAMMVISIQSQVVHGHVGNSAASFALQPLGIEVAAVPTVPFSNHPRCSSVHGKVLETAFVRELLAGVEERGLVDKCKILISGYLGSPEIAAVVSGLVAGENEESKTALSLRSGHGRCWPGFFVGEELRAPFAENLVPTADVLTPNQFELESLVGKPETIDEIAASARGLGPPMVIVTGVCVKENPPNTIQTLAVEQGAAWVIATPILSCNPSGTGDLFAALLAAALVQGIATKTAPEQAVSGVFAVLETTNRGSYEMALVPSAARLLFTASPISPRTGKRGAGKAPALSC